MLSRLLLLTLLLAPAATAFVPTASATCYWNREMVDDVTVSSFTVAFYDGPQCTAGLECDGKPFPQYPCKPQ